MDGIAWFDYAALGCMVAFILYLVYIYFDQSRDL